MVQASLTLRPEQVCVSPGIRSHESHKLHDQVRLALAQILAPKYVELSFQLPESCVTIWRIIQDDIERMGDEDRFNTDVDAFLAFIHNFFAEAIVQVVKHNLDLCKQSFLGDKYPFRRGKVAIASTIVDDLVDEYVANPGILYGFIGASDGTSSIITTSNSGTRSREAGEGAGVGKRVPLEHGDKWYVVDKKGRTRVAGAGGSSSSGTRSTEAQRGADKSGSDKGGIEQGQGAGGSGDGGDGDHVPMKEDFGAPFCCMEFIHVLLPKFSTPPRRTTGRSMTLKARSSLFSTHGNVREQKPYNPNTNINGMLSFYHGTRSSSLSSFQRDGIYPEKLRTEFCRQPAFYLTNSIAHAYEHPLHNHLSRYPDPVSVLVFVIDVEVLCGRKDLEDGSSRFTVRGFPDTPEMFAEWYEFVIGNMWGKQRRLAQYDIVIGPGCIPDMEHATVSKRTDQLQDGIPLTQVAFCTERARVWLGRHVKKVYCEERSP